MMATIRIPKSKRSEYVTMTSPPSDVVEEEKRSAASSRRRGLPPTEYWQRQRISMRRGYYSTFCRIWQSQLRYVLIYVLRLAPGGVLCYGIARKIREVFL